MVRYALSRSALLSSIGHTPHILMNESKSSKTSPSPALVEAYQASTLSPNGGEGVDSFFSSLPVKEAETKLSPVLRRMAAATAAGHLARPESSLSRCR